MNAAWIKHGGQGVDPLPDAPLQTCNGVAVGKRWNGSVLRFKDRYRRFWRGTSTFLVNLRSGDLRLLVPVLLVFVGPLGLFRVSRKD